MEIVLKKLIGLNLKTINNNEEELSICLEGKAIDELELISKSIETLSKQIELKEMSNDEVERVNNEVKKVLFAVAENYRDAGLLEHLKNQLESISSSYGKDPKKNDYNEL